MNLGETIKTLREEIGIKPPELAGKCGVSPQHVYDIEASKRNPSEKLLRRMAEHLNSDLEPLLDLMKRRKELIRRVRSNPEEFEALILEEEK